MQEGERGEFSFPPPHELPSNARPPDADLPKGSSENSGNHLPPIPTTETERDEGKCTCKPEPPRPSESLTPTEGGKQEEDSPPKDTEEELEKLVQGIENEPQGIEDELQRIESKLKTILPEVEIKPLSRRERWIAQFFLHVLLPLIEKNPPLLSHILSAFSRFLRAKGEKMLASPEATTAPTPEGRQLPPPAESRAESAWGAYALLNLGPLVRERPELARAARFFHMVPIQGELGELTGDVREKLFELFNKNAFPWINSDCSITRSYGVEITSPEEIAVIDVKSGEEVNFQELPAGKIAVLINNEGLPLQNLPNFHELLNNYAFVLVVSPSQKDLNFGTITIGANHEYIDGVPAADLACRLAESLGFTILPPDSSLKEVLDQLDQWENGLPSESSSDFQVKTVIINGNLAQNIFNLYDRLNATYKEISKDTEGFSFNTFLQLLLHNLYLKDGRVRGGVLGFNNCLNGQLEHYRLPDYPQGPLFALIKALQENNLQRIKEILNIYNPKYANIEPIIGPIKSGVPQKFWPLLNQLSKELGVTRALAGQVMTSVIPLGFDAGKGTNETRKIYGIGGPAMTEFQDVAFTFTFSQKGGSSVIIIRLKARRL